MKKILLLLAAVGMIFTACEGSDGVEEDNGGTPFAPGITISPKDLTFGCNGGEKAVVIIANFEYVYLTNADWLTLKKSENGVNITATPNTKFEKRTAEITISSEKYGISKAITITQQGVSAKAQNVILYTSSDGKIVTPYGSMDFGANIVSNTYEDGQGVIIFDAPVTTIGGVAFYICTSLTSVTIPDSVTSIGNLAFYDCTLLEAFYGKFASSDNRCLIIDGVLNSFAPAELTNYVIPNSVTSIGYRAFSNCTSLTSVTIGNSVTSIGGHAFDDCTSLTSVTIPDSVTEIGSDAFYNCTSLTSVTIPDSVTSIGSRAFSGCTGELTVNCNIPSVSHGFSAFYGSRFTKVTIGNSVTSIGGHAFDDCDSLTSVTIGNSVTEIGRRAFYNCTGELTVNCNIPSVSWYEDGAFYGSRFTKVTIGNSVTSIGNIGFSGCDSLKEVYCRPTTPPTGNYGMFDNNASGRKIYVPRNSVEAYKAADGWWWYASDIVGYDFEE